MLTLRNHRARERKIGESEFEEHHDDQPREPWLEIDCAGVLVHADIGCCGLMYYNETGDEPKFFRAEARRRSTTHSTITNAAAAQVIRQPVVIDAG